MKRIEIADSSQIILALQDGIRRLEDARYDYRLHAVLLIAQGLPVLRFRKYWVILSVPSRIGSTVSNSMDSQAYRIIFDLVGL